METYIIVIILILIVIYLLFNNFIKKQVMHKHVLAHRENTIKGVKEAIDLNFKGVEIDIFYDESRQDLVVSHHHYDDPKTVLSLDELLKIDCSKCSDKFIVWLDFKNLTLNNVFTSINLLTEYQKKYSNKYLFVESENYLGLLFISFFSKINTSYWINGWDELLLPNFFTYTSLNYSYFDKNPAVYKILSKNPINLFTINNENKLKDFNSINEISMLLTDTPSSGPFVLD